MDANLKLLEERVLQAARQLRELSGERSRLEQELREARRRLEAVATGPGAASEEAGIVEVLREAVREFREA